MPTLVQLGYFLNSEITCSISRNSGLEITNSSPLSPDILTHIYNSMLKCPAKILDGGYIIDSPLTWGKKTPNIANRAAPSQILIIWQRVAPRGCELSYVPIRTLASLDVTYAELLSLIQT